MAIERAKGSGAPVLIPASGVDLDGGPALLLRLPNQLLKLPETHRLLLPATLLLETQR